MDGTMFDTERLRFQTLQQASQELIGQEFSRIFNAMFGVKCDYSGKACTTFIRE